jgi:hypothetical protein
LAVRTLDLLRTGLLIAASALPLAASAQITIAVGAQEVTAGGWSDEVTFGASVTQAWGHAGVAVPNDPFGHIEEGVPRCHIVPCGPAIGLPGASGGARADATKMSVGVRGRAASGGDSQGFGEASVRDTLSVATAGILTFDIRLDLALSASAGSEARYSFGITLGRGDERRGVFGFIAQEDSGVRTAEVFLENGTIVETLSTIPSTFERIINVPVPAGFLPIELSASGVAEAGGGEFALVSAFDSAWLGLGGLAFTSVNGYSYPGFAAAIPEPSQAALLLAGIAIVGWGYRRRRSCARAPS